MRSRLAQATLNHYVWILRHFFAHLRSSGIDDAARVRAADIAHYRQLLAETPTRWSRPPTATYMNAVLAAIKALYAWLVEIDAIGHDPTRKIAAARAPKRLPKTVLSVEETIRIIEAAELSTPLGVRDRAILELMYATGVRRAELLALNVNDLSIEDHIVRVERGKGGRTRMVPFGQVAAEILDRYLPW